MEKDYSQFKYYKGERDCPFSDKTETEKVRWWDFEKSYFDNYKDNNQWDDFMDFFTDWIRRKAAPENNGYDLSKGSPWLESYLENIPKLIIEKDYSMYRYYDGTDKYPNKKAAFFGFYERSFECTYKGSLEDKKEKFMDFMLELLYEQCSDSCHFGEPSVDKDKSFEDYIRVYYEPNYKLENYE